MEPLVKLGKERWGEVVYSPDDGGWYVSICNRAGKTVSTTDICPTRATALKAATKLSR